MAKRPKMQRDAVSPFRDKLWELFKEQASGLDGGDVVSALKQAGEEIWGVGIDDTYSSMKHQNDEALGNRHYLANGRLHQVEGNKSW